MAAALIVIDIQNDFCPGGALAVPFGDEVVPVANRLMGIFGVAVLTQDWHPAGHVSFASSFGAPPFSKDPRSSTDNLLWPDHCVSGSRGADFHPALDTSKASLVLRKGMNPGIDSYSAFMENDRRTASGLAGWLKERRIDSIALVGLAADYCVKASALDGIAMGFRVAVVLEGTRAVDVRTGEDALQSMEKSGCRLLHESDVRKWIQE